MLSIPEHARIIDLPTSRIWREDSGIVCVVSKKVEPQTVEQAREAIKLFRDYIGSEKVCMLIDVTNSSESSREVREFVAEEFPKLVKAIAMVSNSALGKMLANLFFNLKSQPYPVKMFNDETEARIWLKNYL
jgi:hypothetical protein